jgi:hypothetical protein
MNIVPSSLLRISESLKNTTKYVLISKPIIDNVIDPKDSQA